MAQHAKEVARSRSGPVVDSSIFQVHVEFMCQRNPHTSLIHRHNPLSDHHLLRPLVSAVINSKTNWNLLLLLSSHIRRRGGIDRCAISFFSGLKL
jgi:hypothetical protein